MGQPVTWWKKFKFRVEIDGVTRAAFQKCSPIDIEAANVEYKEGGRLHPHNAPGTVKFAEITLERGACDDFDLYNLFKNTYDAAAGTGQETPDIYISGDIVQMDRKGKDVERYTFRDAYCRKFSSGDWDNNADEVRIEQIILVPDMVERVAA
jgi:phage tail-like protein